MLKKYTVSAIITTEIEVEGDVDPKEEAIQWLNLNLPPEFAFAIHSLKKQTRNKILGEFAPEEVFPYITDEETFRFYNVGNKSYRVRMNSLRYQTFRANQSCVACGIQGNIFLLEISPPATRPHFNFYHRDGNRLILMTKDHIIPRSLGGSEKLSNLQTMCSTCNNLKDCYDFSSEQLAELREIYQTVRRGITENEFRRKLKEVKNRLIAENAKKLIPGTMVSAM